jgi:asparagine synthase (glutamine-hydrolysing)
MCKAMRHQPPTGEAIWLGSGVGLACLSFREVDGAEPACNADSTARAVADADVLNYANLCNALPQKGQSAAKGNHAALFTCLYEREGTDFAKHVNGHFAIAIWDVFKRELVLIRDRFGARPLYYTVVHDRLFFASEIKALLALDNIKPRLDMAAFFEYFTFQTTLGDRTWFEGVRLLPPGTLLRFRDGFASQETYWDLIYCEDEDVGEDACVGQLREQLARTMRRHVVADRSRVGSFLGGGMDTGSIVAFGSRYLRPLPAFHCGYDMRGVSSDEMSFSETEPARKLAHQFGADLHEIILSPMALQRTLPWVIWYLEGPRINVSYPNYLVGRLASRYVDIVLTGTGGDEFYGGYPWRYTQIKECYDRKKFESLYYQLRARLIKEDQRADAFSAFVAGQAQDYSTFDSFRHILNPVQAIEPLHWAMYFDVKTAVHDLLLVNAQLNGAHGLACRSPLLDNELVSLVLGIPAKYKLSEMDSKYILKRALKDILSHEFLKRPKIGFISPDGSWYRGAAREYVQGLVLGHRALERNYFKESYVRQVMREHTEGKVNHRGLLWSLMCFEWWNRLFLDGDPLPEPEETDLVGVQE